MDKRGFTVLEIILVVFILGIILGIAMPSATGIYDRLLLATTANEIQSALYLGQQKSVDESKAYCFEIVPGGFRVREDIFRGQVIHRGIINPRIQIVVGHHSRVVFNRHGETGYTLYILENQQGQRIRIEVMIGTGRVRRTNNY